MHTDAPSVLPGPLVSIHSDVPGQVTVRLVGLPELQATAPTREEALKHLQQLVCEALTAGRLAALDMPTENPLMDWFGYARNDPEFAAYVGEVGRPRQQLDHDSQEMEDNGCSSSSSTPTT